MHFEIGGLLSHNFITMTNKVDIPTHQIQERNQIHLPESATDRILLQDVD